MSNLPHSIIRRSERGPRAEADGDKDPSNGSSAQPHEMESHLVSSDAMTESPDTDSSDELTEVVAAETSPSVSGSPGVRMGVSGNAIPVPELEPEDPVEANTYIRTIFTDNSAAGRLDFAIKISRAYGRNSDETAGINQLRHPAGLHISVDRPMLNC